MPLRTISLTLYGEPVTGLVLTVGETLLFDMALQDPDARTAINLTGCTVTLSIAALDIQGNPTVPAAVTKAGITTGAANLGISRVTLASSDTAALAIGTYAMDVWLTDATGQRLDMMPISPVKVLGAATV